MLDIEEDWKNGEAKKKGESKNALKFKSFEKQNAGNNRTSTEKSQG